MSRGHFSQSVARKISNKSRKDFDKKVMIILLIVIEQRSVFLVFSITISHTLVRQKFPSENAEKNVVSYVVF